MRLVSYWSRQHLSYEIGHQKRNLNKKALQRDLIMDFFHDRVRRRREIPILMHLPTSFLQTGYSFLVKVVFFPGAQGYLAV